MSLRRSIAIFLLVCTVCAQALAAQAEIMSFTSTIRQPFGGSQSPDDARAAAITRAKRLALEQAGTYLESLSLVRDAALEQEEILALTAGVSKVQVLQEEKYLDGEQFGLEITALVEVDTSVLQERVRKLLEDRKHLAELQAAQEREKELLAKVEALEAENRELSQAVNTTHTAMHKQRIQEQFKEATLGLGAVEHFQDALALWSGSGFSDPRKALDCLNRAIYLDPNYAAAYNNRGIAQGQLGHFLNAISDFNTALRLDPGRTSAYLTNRGYAHLRLDQNREAVADFTQALSHDGGNAIAHSNLGLALSRLGEASAALEELNVALRLDPGFAMAWFNRGFLYDGMGERTKADRDYTKALSLDPGLSEAYFNRGGLRLEAGDLQGAVSDFTAYLKDDPEDVDALLMRGNAFARLNRPGLMCIDFEAACRQGFCKHLRQYQMQGMCR